MNWVAWVIIITIGIYIALFAALLVINKKKSVGLGQFARTPEQVEECVSQRVAPAPFYYKQRTFRMCYGLNHMLDKMLLMTSVVYSALTAYLILDASISVSYTVVCLVFSTTASTLKAALGLGEKAKPYIKAVRIMENAILRYEYSSASDLDPNSASDPAPQSEKQKNPFEILLDANERAEKIIAQDYE